MTSEPKAPGAPAIYLYRQVDRKDLGRANTEYNYVRIKILTEEGRENANISIPYLSNTTGISNIRARTIHADGSIVNFDGKVFDKMVEKTKGIRIKTKVFTVPDISERNEDDEARKKFLEDQLQSYIPVIIESDFTNQPDWKSTETPLVAEFKLKVPGWVFGAGHRALMPVGLFGGTEKQIFAHAERQYPVCFSFPFQKKDDVTIELPAGWTISSVPQPLDKDARAAEYTLKVEDGKTQVRITRTVRSDLFLIPKENYLALRQFFQIVRSGDDQQIILQPAAVAAAH